MKGPDVRFGLIGGFAAWLLLTPSIVHTQTTVPRIRLTEEWRIDGDSADLVPIDWLAVRRDGSIAVSQEQLSSVRFFDAKGVAIGALGRKGSGPGEFELLNWAGFVGDTLWVLDWRQHRLTLIGPNRELVRTVPVPVSAHAGKGNTSLPDFGLVAPEAVYSDGSFLARVVHPVGPNASKRDDGLVTHALLTANGTIIKLVSEYDGSGTAISISTSNGGGAGAPVPFPTAPIYKVSPDGSRIAIVSVSGETIIVRMVASSGSPLFERRYGFKGVTIPKSVGDSAIAVILKSIRNPELVAAFRKQVTIPRFYPPITSIVLDRDGSVWLGERPLSNGVSYMVLAPDGKLVGRATLPAKAEIVAVDGKKVWAVLTDELDVQSVVCYRAER